MPPDFTKNLNNNFAEIIPDHPHRRMKVLLSILAFVVAAGGVVFYQMGKVKEDVVVSPPVTDKKVVTRDEMIGDYKEYLAKIPPPTTEQEQARIKMIEDYKKSLAKLKK